MRDKDFQAAAADAAASLPDGVHFVSGIDTDAGKTVCTGWLARELLKAGRKVATMKLVQTGCRDFSPDIALHRRIMGVELPEDGEGVTAPELYSYPASPHLSSKIDGRPLDLERIKDCAKTLAERYEVVLVEGAGGLMVPLTPALLTIDFACSMHWPFVFVGNGKLGSINHALLSLEAIAARKAVLSAFLFNDFNPVPDTIIEEDSRAYLYAHVRSHFPQALWLECPVFPPEAL